MEYPPTDFSVPEHSPAEYFVLAYPYRLNILYCNVPIEGIFCIGMTQTAVLDFDIYKKLYL
jgi:hypothetical protein